MSTKPYLFLSLFLFFFLISACTRQVGDMQPVGDPSHCQIIYDAGSSRTRLYVYELTANGWLEHTGPRSDALADPVRANRGKTMADAADVIDGLVEALEDLRSDGPLDEKGKPRWPAFDWRKECIIDAAAVYATGGMRLAEQQDAQTSNQLWKMLNDRLSTELGMEVVTRTLSGYEEGLFAWLAIRERLTDENIGIVEMGGASVQITFPCTDCTAAKLVRVQGRLIPIFSHSFLGWGQDEAHKKTGPMPACAVGVGKQFPDWRVADCSDGMALTADDLVDEIRAQVTNNVERDWYLGGAFGYMRDEDINNYCRNGADSGFEQGTSCFRAVYLEEVLDTLGIPDEAEVADADWTLGAVVCTATQCLQ